MSVSSNTLCDAVVCKDSEDGKSFESTTNNSSREVSIREEIAKRESANVYRLKLLVITTMLISSAVISVAMFISSRNSELDELELQFLGASKLLTDSFIHIAEKRIEAMAALKVAVVSHGLYYSESRSWPFVTIPNFQERSRIVHDSSMSLFVSLHPLVNDVYRSKWEQYVAGSGSHWM
jgi:hypothetical protein